MFAFVREEMKMKPRFLISEPLWIISIRRKPVEEGVSELRVNWGPGQDCLADCKEEGVKPEKPTSGKLLLRVFPEVHGKALVAAQASGNNFNQWATEVFQNAVQAGG